MEIKMNYERSKEPRFLSDNNEDLKKGDRILVITDAGWEQTVFSHKQDNLFIDTYGFKYNRCIKLIK